MPRKSSLQWVTFSYLCPRHFLVLRCRCRMNMIVAEHESEGWGLGKGGFSRDLQKPLSHLCLERIWEFWKCNLISQVWIKVGHAVQNNKINWNPENLNIFWGLCLQYKEKSSPIQVPVSVCERISRVFPTTLHSTWLSGGMMTIPESLHVQGHVW